MSDQQPGWHPDPGGRHEHRYWDGTRWTDDVADGGVAGTEPLPPGGTDPTVAMSAGAAGGGAPPAGPGPLPGDPVTAAESGARRGVVIAVIALAVVALAVGAILAFGGSDDDDDGDRAAAVGEDLDDRADTRPSGPFGGDADDFDFEDLEAFGDLDLDDLGPFGDLGDFDPNDVVGSIAELYESLFGLSSAQATCLAEELVDLEDGDGFPTDAVGSIFGLLDACGISINDLGGFDAGN